MNRALRSRQKLRWPAILRAEQVTNGIAVRMALLFLLIAGHAKGVPIREKPATAESRATDIKDPSHASRLKMDALSIRARKPDASLDVLLDGEQIAEIAPPGKILDECGSRFLTPAA